MYFFDKYRMIELSRYSSARKQQISDAVEQCGIIGPHRDGLPVTENTEVIHADAEYRKHDHYL